MKKLILPLLFFFALLSSCGYYSFKGALPSHLQTIAIPIFADKTSYPNVRENLTDRLIEAFINDNTLKVVDESKADLLINGTVQSIQTQAAAVQSGETVTDLQVYVNVRVVCEDIKMSKKLFEKTFRHYGLMDANGGQAEQDEAIAEAIELITEDILNTTLGGW